MPRAFRRLALIVIALAAGASGASGLSPGEEVAAWEPVHLAGPHAGTKTCPVCTYLDAPVLLAFARDAAAATPLVRPLEAIAAAHEKGRLKVLLVVVNGGDELRQFATDHGVRRLMLCRPDPERWVKQLAAYKIDPKAANTILLYQDYTVKRRWAALAPAQLPELKAATDPHLPRQ